MCVPSSNLIRYKEFKYKMVDNDGDFDVVNMILRFVLKPEIFAEYFRSTLNVCQ